MEVTAEMEDTGAMVFLDPSNLLLFGLGLVVLGLKLWALIDACLRPAPAYVAAGKLSKIAWIAILAAAVLVRGAEVLGLLGLVGTIAAIVYLVDVRPAVRAIRPGGPWG